MRDIRPDISSVNRRPRTVRLMSHRFDFVCGRGGGAAKSFCSKINRGHHISVPSPTFPFFLSLDPLSLSIAGQSQRCGSAGILFYFVSLLAGCDRRPVPLTAKAAPLKEYSVRLVRGWPSTRHPARPACPSTGGGALAHRPAYFPTLQA